MSMRIVISGGGTGGHIIPGIAIAKQLQKQISDVELLWIGVGGRRESELVPRQQIPFKAIAGKGIKRSFSPGAVIWNVRALLAALLGIVQAFMLLRRFKPHGVIGTGGYVCFPVLFSAWLLRIPRIICEQNSIPGLTVKMITRLADKVVITYSETERYLPKTGTIVTLGNPVSDDLTLIDTDSAKAELELPPDRCILLVLGGSLGAQVINSQIVTLVNHPLWTQELSSKWFILHSTGQEKFAQVNENTRGALSYRAVPFIYENYKALAAATVVLSRAGATTLAEISVRGVPSILVPWRGATHDHQLKNAELFKTHNAAVLLLEPEFTVDKLIELLNKFSVDTMFREAMSRQVRELAKPRAAQQIVEAILGLMHEGTK